MRNSDGITPGGGGLKHIRGIESEHPVNVSPRWPTDAELRIKDYRDITSSLYSMY